MLFRGRMGKPTGYWLASYGNMITERPRMGPYARALRQVVRPGCTVLDIGAGTGIFSLLACQLGAGHVHAVEPNGAIQVARQLATANGFSDRITFHQALSTEVCLPTPADVMVSDLRGVLPFFQHHIPSIVDARQRLLASGGVLIPCRDTLWATLVEDPELYRPYAEPWLRNDYGLDLSAGQSLVVNTWRKANAKPDQILVEPQCWATLDYTNIVTPNVSGELSWVVERAGTAHGLLVWFGAELVNGIGFPNAPGEPELIYGQAFFPLQEPVVLEGGDTVITRLRADLVDDDYVWQWDTQVMVRGDAGCVKARFRQSTFHGAPISLDQLKQREAGFIPQRTEAAEITQFVLSMMDGWTPLGDIAAALTARFPKRFARQQDALTWAADLAEQYSR